jgi:phage recombination protein Bet
MTSALAEAPAKAQGHVPEAVQRRGLSEPQWRALFNLFPGGKPDSVLLVYDYCITRKLDPFKKPCHIVEMDYKDADGQWRKRDVVMPGIYEYRITAHRTGLYLGHTQPEYGPIETIAGVEAPTYCSMEFYRWSEVAKEKIPYPIRVYFSEVVATNRDGNANARWRKAPIQMLTKCTEAAALREMFPEELGGEATAEEMDGRMPSDITVTATTERAEEPRASMRLSEQPQNGGGAPPAPSNPTPSEQSSTASAPSSVSDTPKHIGKIVDVSEGPKSKTNQQSYIVKNEHGFICATWSTTLAEAATQLCRAGTSVELNCRAASDPKYKPILEEIQPVEMAIDVEPAE